MLINNSISVFKKSTENVSVKATYKGGNLKIKEIFYNQFHQPDIEDIVVIEVPLEILRTTIMEVPPVRKEKEIGNLVFLELSRSLDTNSKIVFSYLRTILNKLYVFYMFEEELNRYLSDYPVEPDIVYPQFFSELILLRKVQGTWVYVILNSDSSNVSIFENGNLLNTRVSELALKDIFDMLKEETGFNLKDIESSKNIELIEQSEKIIETVLPDLISEIQREIYVALNTTNLKKITINDLDGVIIICKSRIILELLKKYSKEEGAFNSKLNEPIFIFNNVLDFDDIGLLGLVYRGGLEFGKVKSLLW